MSSGVRLSGDIVFGMAEFRTTSAPIREFFDCSGASGWMVRFGDEVKVAEGIASRAVAGKVSRMGDDIEIEGLYRCLVNSVSSSRSIRHLVVLWYTE